MNSRYLQLILSLAFLLFPVLLGAQNAYFCDVQGRKLTYERRYSKNDELKWRHVMTIDKVTNGADGSKAIEYNSSFTKAEGGKMYGGPVHLNASISAGGDVSLDTAESMASVFRNMLPSAANIKTEGGVTVLPCALNPGMTLPDVSALVSAAGLKYTTVVSERLVDRTERISTKAGEFDCVVVKEHKVEKGPGRNRVTTAYTWYAKGIGMVRHDTYDKNLRLETSEVLVSVR